MLKKVLYFQAICIQKKKVVQKHYVFFCEIVDRICYLSYPDARISAPSIYYTKNQNLRLSKYSNRCSIYLLRRMIYLYGQVQTLMMEVLKYAYIKIIIFHIFLIYSSSHKYRKSICSRNLNVYIVSKSLLNSILRFEYQL